MRPWTWQQRLFAPADEGLDGTTDVDDVVEHDNEPEADEPEAKGAKPNDEVETLKEQVARLTREKEASDEEATFWAARARRGAADEPDTRRQAAEEDDTEDEPRIVDAKPENLLDDLTTRGLDALADRGIVTKKDLKEALAQITTATTEQIQTARSDAEFGLRIADEFPEFAEESKKIDEAKARGERYRPTDPHFLLTGKLAREAAALNGGKMDAATIIMAAKLARAEMKADGTWRKDGNGTQRTTKDPATRRSRIERLNPPRGEAPEGDEDATAGYTAEQREVMKRLKVSPEVFAKQARKPVGGRRRG